MEEKTQESEFGKGFIYNLVLFAKHFERWNILKQADEEMNKKDPTRTFSLTSELWFNGAADHLYELEVPPQFVETEIGRLAVELREEGLRRRLMVSTSAEEFGAFFDKLETLCRLIDEALGVTPIKATYN